jgi:hypothetical protein
MFCDMVSNAEPSTAPGLHVHSPKPSPAEAFLQKEESDDATRVFPYSVPIPSQHAILLWGELAAQLADPGCTPPPLLTTMAALLRRPAVDAVHAAQVACARNGQRLNILAPVDASGSDRTFQAVDREAMAAGCASALLTRSLQLCVVPAPIQLPIFETCSTRLVDVLVATADVAALLEVSRYPFLVCRVAPTRRPDIDPSETTSWRTMFCSPPHPTDALHDVSMRAALACLVLRTGPSVAGHANIYRVRLAEAPTEDPGRDRVAATAAFTEEPELRALTLCMRSAVDHQSASDSPTTTLKRLMGCPGSLSMSALLHRASEAVTPRRVAHVRWWDACSKQPRWSDMAPAALLHYRAVRCAHTLRTPTSANTTALAADVVSLLRGEVLGPLQAALRHRCDTIATSWTSLPEDTDWLKGPIAMRGEARLHLYTTPMGGMGADPSSYTRLLSRLWMRCAAAVDLRTACLVSIAALVRNDAADVALAFAVVAEGRGLAVLGATEDFTYPQLWRRNRQHDLRCQLACHTNEGCYAGKTCR